MTTVEVESVSNSIQQLKISPRRTIERKYRPYTISTLENEEARDAYSAMLDLDLLLSGRDEPDIKAADACKLLPIIEKGLENEYKEELMTLCLFGSDLAGLSLLYEGITDPQLRKQINTFFHKYTNADCSLDTAIEVYYDIRGLDPDADLILGITDDDYELPSWMKI